MSIWDSTWLGCLKIHSMVLHPPLWLQEELPFCYQHISFFSCHLFSHVGSLSKSMTPLRWPQRGLWLSKSRTSLLNSFATIPECWNLPRSAYRMPNHISVCPGHQEAWVVPHVISKSFWSLLGTEDCSLPASRSLSLCLVHPAPL